MSLLVRSPGPSAVRRSGGARAPVQVRSVVPGRQRWDVPAILGRPHLAQLVESALSAVDGIHEVRANPVTGRVLLLHDPRTAPREVARVLGRCVADVCARTAAVSGGEPARDGARTDAGARRAAAGATAGLSPLLIAGGGATAALALGCGKAAFSVLTQPLVALGLVTVGTTVVIRRAWRRSGLARSDPDAPGPGEPGPGRRRGQNAYLGMVAGRRRKFGVAASLSVLSQVVESGLFAVSAFTLMTVIRGGSTALTRLGVLGLGRQLAFLGTGIGAATLLLMGLSYSAGRTWHKLGKEVEHEWRTRTYDHVQRMKPSVLEDERASRIAQVLTEDVGQLGDFVGRTMHESIALVTCFGVMVGAYLLLAPQVAWAAMLPIPLVTWLSLRFHSRAVADHEAAGARKSQLYAQVVNNLQANQTVKASCTEDYEARRIGELSDAHCDAAHRTDRSALAQTHLVRLCAGATLPFTMLLGSRALFAGALTVERFAPLFDMPPAALWRLNRLGDITDEHQRALAAFDRVRYLHSLPVEADGEGEPPATRRGPGRITLEKVTFAYPGRPPVLRNLSMEMAQGQVTGIVGSTGAGKTTVAKLLMRFEHPDSGCVRLDGRNVSQMSLRELRGAIGYVAQEPFLFDGTIADNIEYGTFAADRRRIVEAARKAGADTFIEALPDGYDTRVGERGAALSGGQKQRIALARMILNAPPIVILDEATSAVDYETEAVIQRALNAFAHRRTLIVIAHRLSTIRNADRIYVLDRGGVLAEKGTHEELLRSGGRYASLWNLQTGERAAGLPVVTQQNGRSS
ncbi:ABC transporter ATP-binding protein/permease [Streptomyces albus]|uniref:ABC transporter ATP-binding protein/permease n=1 Tax=Streptomyces albus TaxID=1888 RepID=UPI00099E8CDB|nr:ABC transporter ATP-binding protein/permease [Streptomyces albus]